MNYPRTCDGQRQPCPHPFLCNPDCQFNCATRLETGNSDSSNPGYDFTLLDAPGNFWDRCNWWQRILVACAAVALCSVLGGMVVGHLAGLK